VRTCYALRRGFDAASKDPALLAEAKKPPSLRADHNSPATLMSEMREVRTASCDYT
jgi:hypothetical protein